VYISCGSQLRSHTTASEIFTTATIGRQLEVRERLQGEGPGNCGFGGLEDQRTGEPETRRRSCWRRPLGRDHRSDLTRFKPSHMLGVFFSFWISTRVACIYFISNSTRHATTMTLDWIFMATNGAKIKSPSHGARERKKNITVEEKKSGHTWRWFLDADGLLLHVRGDHALFWGGL